MKPIIDEEDPVLIVVWEEGLWSMRQHNEGSLQAISPIDSRMVMPKVGAWLLIHLNKAGHRMVLQHKAGNGHTQL